MNGPKTVKRGGAALWKAIQDSEVEDDIEEILAMSDAELDGYIRANGGDPVAIGAAGEALAKELLERSERLAWHGDARKELEAFRAVAAASRSGEPLPRPELLRRLAAARTDPRFATPVATLFHKKTVEASTDLELQALLDQIELLAKLEES
jgi:hypothetical protein